MEPLISPRILLCDDEQNDRLLTISALAREFASPTVREVFTADDFAHALDQDGWDLLITDYQLRWSDGITLVRSFKSRHPHVPAVMFTGSGNEELAVSAMKAGLDDYVVKSSHQYTRLARVVRGTLERYAALQKAEAAARAAEHVRREFLARMSHELRTPLTGILGFLDLLSEGELTSDQLEYVDLARYSGKALLNLVQDILDFSKVEAGHLDLHHHVFDLPEFLDRFAKLAHSNAAGRNVKFLCRTSGILPARIKADSDRISQVLRNLVDNALKFSPPGGRVKLEVRSIDQAAGQVVLEFGVQDDGPGVPAAERERIFESFAQADEGVSRRYGGAGLGLPIARSLARLMGGDVWLPEQPGKGALFNARVCVENADQESGESTQTEVSEELLLADLKKRQPKLLFLEDDPTIEHLVRSQLAGLEAKVVVVRRGEELVSVFQRDVPDVVFVDIHVPGMDGTMVLNRIRQLPNGMFACCKRRIAFTAYARPEEIREFLNAGFDEVVVKPFRRKELLASIRRAYPMTRGDLCATSVETTCED